MLFVNDHKPQTTELYIIFKYGMSTYKNVDTALYQTFEYPLTAFTPNAARQQLDFDSQTLQIAVDIGIVLFGENFGRRHNTGLITVIYGNEHGH
ncbi:MAG: hypothetical protein BWY95_01066 [Bacteroidetes bacterium ADurb.BinA104]|nr:MAG: hypothetical protein BWY95_01066 [Bacteroidetes bacterium ADurb.BinA104]